MAPGADIDLELMRASMLLESDPAAAARLASAMLERSPGNEAAQLLLATASQKAGDSTRSQALLSSLASAQPDSATLQLELGRASAAAGRNAEAIRPLRLQLHSTAASRTRGTGSRRNDSPPATPSAAIGRTPNTSARPRSRRSSMTRQTP